VAFQRKPVLLFPGDREFLNENLRSRTHQHPGQRAHETILVQNIKKRLFPHAGPPARILGEIGGIRGAFHSSCDPCADITQAQTVADEHGSLEARAATLVDCECRDRLGKPGLEKGDACRVRPDTSLPPVAHHNFTDVICGQTAAG